MQKQQMSLDFSTNSDGGEILTRPLAFRSRPINFEQYAGQSNPLKMIQSLDLNNLPHLVFWGPPGCGKTTLAHVLAKHAELELYAFSAVLSGVAELRKLINSVLDMKKMYGKKSIIFIDEIHRFNKGQQDALLPYLEQGDFILFGATTEYPQTSLNRAVISRVKPVELSKLTDKDIQNILNQACEGESIECPDKFLELIAKLANGDARYALNNLESLIGIEDYQSMDIAEYETKLLENARHYDKNSNRHYDVVSAFIKSIRGSDVNAAILWLAVMLDGGEDPVFVARRLMISASEDIGNADPRAIQMANSAHYAVSNVGMPEARIILAQAVTYLAQAPKSNASYLAIDSALDFVRSNPTIEVPGHLRGTGPEKKNYQYAHSFHNHYVDQVYQPTDQEFFESSEMGYEKMQQDYMNKIKK